MASTRSTRPRGFSIALLFLLIALCGLLLCSAVPGVHRPAVPDITETPTPSSLPEPTPYFTAEMTASPSPSPSPDPTEPPAAQTEPSLAPVVIIDEQPTAAPTVEPTPQPTPDPTAEPTPSLMPADPSFPPDYAYETDKVRIEVRRYEIKNVVYFTAEIWLTEPSQLRSAFSSGKFDGATETVQDIATRNNAILAINGDFATFNNGGIIIREGISYRTNRSTRQLLVIDVNGDFIPYQVPPDKAEEAAAEFIAAGVWQTFVFGPVLVENSQAVELPKDFFVNTGLATEPRTAIAQLGPLHYLWMVVDGRKEGYSQGVSLARLQELLLEHGAVTAFNLDGGGSSTLFYDGKILNKPANGGQRHVPDILYIGY